MATKEKKKAAGLDPMLVDGAAEAAARVEGTTSDAATRDADVHVDEVGADLGEGEKPSEGGPERYPFPPQGDVEVATVDPGKGKGEFLAPIEVEDWVVLDDHELVPDRLVGRRARVIEPGPRELIPVKDAKDVWIKVQTRDEVNATLYIPLTAVKEVQKGGFDASTRG